MSYYDLTLDEFKELEDYLENENTQEFMRNLVFEYLQEYSDRRNTNEDFGEWITRTKKNTLNGGFLKLLHQYITVRQKYHEFLLEKQHQNEFDMVEMELPLLEEDVDFPYKRDEDTKFVALVHPLFSLLDPLIDELIVKRKSEKRKKTKHLRHLVLVGNETESSEEERRQRNKAIMKSHGMLSDDEVEEVVKIDHDLNDEFRFMRNEEGVEDEEEIEENPELTQIEVAKLTKAQKRRQQFNWLQYLVDDKTIRSTRFKFPNTKRQLFEKFSRFKNMDDNEYLIYREIFKEWHRRALQKFKRRQTDLDYSDTESTGSSAYGSESDPIKIKIDDKVKQKLIKESNRFFNYYKNQFNVMKLDKIILLAKRTNNFSRRFIYNLELYMNLLLKYPTDDLDKTEVKSKIEPEYGYFLIWAKPIFEAFQGAIDRRNEEKKLLILDQNPFFEIESESKIIDLSEEEEDMNAFKVPVFKFEIDEEELSPLQILDKIIKETKEDIVEKLNLTSSSNKKDDFDIDEESFPDVDENEVIYVNTSREMIDDLEDISSPSFEDIQNITATSIEQSANESQNAIIQNASMGLELALASQTIEGEAQEAQEAVNSFLIAENVNEAEQKSKKEESMKSEPGDVSFHLLSDEAAIAAAAAEAAELAKKKKGDGIRDEELIDIPEAKRYLDFDIHDLSYDISFLPSNDPSVYKPLEIISYIGLTRTPGF